MGNAKYVSMDKTHKEIKGIVALARNLDAAYTDLIEASGTGGDTREMEKSYIARVEDLLKFLKNDPNLDKLRI